MPWQVWLSLVVSQETGVKAQDGKIELQGQTAQPSKAGIPDPLGIVIRQRRRGARATDDLRSARKPRCDCRPVYSTRCVEARLQARVDQAHVVRARFRQRKGYF